LREIQSPTGLHYRTHESPEDLAVLTDQVARQSQVWIDTETADWNTRSPRLSLVQLRLEDGSIHVIDVLSPEMAAAYHSTFAPRVIAAARFPEGARFGRHQRQLRVDGVAGTRRRAVVRLVLGGRAKYHFDICSPLDTPQGLGRGYFVSGGPLAC